jgi:phage terminase large subunit-like protein
MLDFSIPSVKERFRKSLEILAKAHEAEGVKPEKMELELGMDAMILMKQLASEDFWFFLTEILGVKGLNRQFHGDMCDFMQQEGEQKLILAPRGHLKSTICTVYYALWRMCRNPNIRILIANYKLQLASSLLFQIRNEFMMNEGLQTYYATLLPDLRKVKWNETEITVARTANPKEATVEVAGVGAEITGRHYDLIICDDVVGPGNITTKDQIDKVLQWFNQLEFLLDPGGDQVMVGTRWHFDDLYGHIQEHLAPPYSVFKRGIWAPDGEPVWPEKFTKKRILDLKERVEKDPKQGPGVFVSQYMNEVMDEATADFKRQYLKEYEMKDLPEALAVTLTVDPAISEKESADFTAMTVRAVDQEGNWWVLEAFAQRGMTPMDLIDKVFELYVKWRGLGYEPDGVAIEYVAYQKALQFILIDEMRKRNIWLPMMDLKNHRNTKEYRIRGALATRWQLGAIRIPKHHEGSVPELLDQLFRFPKTSHDDLIDSLAMHDEMPVLAPHPRVRQENEEYDYPDKKRDRYGYAVDTEELSNVGLFL